MAKIANLPELKPVVPDDPTTPTSGRTQESPTTKATGEKPIAAAPETPAGAAPTANIGEVDTWAGLTSAATHKLPVELILELEKRIAPLGLTKTATISTALVELFAHDDEEIISRVDAFEERYERARRRAKRN